MPFIDLRKFPLSGFPYHTHNSLSVPVFTSYTLFIYPSSSTISNVIFIPIHPFIPLPSTLLLYSQETHVFLHLDPSSLPRFSGSTDFSTCNPQVNLQVFVISLRMIFFQFHSFAYKCYDVIFLFFNWLFYLFTLQMLTPFKALSP